MRRKVLALFSLALLVLPAPAVRAQDTIIIGEYGSLTGPNATFGTDTDEGVQLAVRQANEAGGINGKKVQVKVYDDQGKSEEAATVVSKLIKNDNVHVVIGEVASSLSLVGGPICQENKIPMVSPSSTNPKVTQVGDYIFRVCFLDPFQGKVMAKFATETLHAKTAGVFVERSSDYAVGLAKYFTETFIALGGQVVSQQDYQKGDTDFKAQLTTFRDKKPDVLFVPGYYTEMGLIAQQAASAGVTAKLAGGDGWDSEKLHEIGGDAIIGAYFSNHYHHSDPRPEVSKFVDAYKTSFNKLPSGLAALGYDAALVVLDAMKRAKSLSGPDIRDALAATKDFSGVTGKITIDPERNASKSAVVLEVTEEGYKVVGSISPAEASAAGAPAPSASPSPGK